jgi:hypothetical protein
MALDTKIADLTKDYQNLINTLFSSNYMVRQGLSNILNELAAEDKKEAVSEIYLIDRLNNYLTNPVFSRDGIKEDPIGVNTINTKYNEEIAEREQADMDERVARTTEDQYIANSVGLDPLSPYKIDTKPALYACVVSGNSWDVPNSVQSTGAKILDSYNTVMGYINAVQKCNEWFAKAGNDYKLTKASETASVLNTDSNPVEVQVLQTLGSTTIAFMQNGGADGSNKCADSTEVEIGSSQALSMCLLGAYKYDSANGDYTTNNVEPAAFLNS